MTHWEKEGRPTVIEPVTDVPKCEQQNHQIIDPTIILDPEKVNKICYEYQLGMMNLGSVTQFVINRVAEKTIPAAKRLWRLF